jgi:hypothetical protein
MSDAIRAIEQAYDFQLPALYQQLYHDGMLNWFLDGGFPNPNWHAHIFPQLRHRPPVLLFAQDFELYAPKPCPTSCRAKPEGQRIDLCP